MPYLYAQQFLSDMAYDVVLAALHLGGLKHKPSIGRVTLHVACWDDESPIHGWFTRNCPSGDVQGWNLMELCDLCQEVLSSNDVTKLPPCSRVFTSIGSIQVWLEGHRELYFRQLQDTVDLLAGWIHGVQLDDWTFCYDPRDKDLEVHSSV